MSDALAEDVDDELEKLLHEDAAVLVQQLKNEYDQASRTSLKVNVLLAGVTGSGKSSLINSIFGCNMAKGAPRSG